MKVQELIKKLQQLDGNCEIRVALRKGWRPISYTKEISDIMEVIEQDSNEIFYCFDIDLDKD